MFIHLLYKKKKMSKINENPYFLQKLENNLFVYRKILILLGISSLIFFVRNILFFSGIDKLSPYYFLVYLAGLLITLCSYLILPALYKRNGKKTAYIFFLGSCSALFFLFVILSFLDSAYINDTDLTAYCMGLLLVGFMLRIDYRISAVICSAGIVLFLSLLSLFTSYAITFQSVLPLVAINTLAVYFSYTREDFFHNVYRDKQAVEKEAMHDSLTETYNRRYMEKELKRLIDRKREQGLPFSCLFIDIDFFKKINDEYGHAFGDNVLRQFASILKKEVRTSDRVIRYGGEEFVVILADTDLPRARETAERFREQIERTHFPSLPAGITASFGIAQATEEDDAASLIERADNYLYQAKREGRNRCCG